MVESVSIRRVSLFPRSAATVLTLLRHIINWNYVRALRFSASSYEDPDLVFATRKGTPLDAQNIVNRHFKPLLKNAGLPPFAGTISGTRAPPCFWGAAFIRKWFSIFWDTPA